MFNTLMSQHKQKTQQEQNSPEQVKNSAGGYSFKVSDWKQLERFLILGVTGGTYYIGEKDLLKQNLDSVRACIQEDPARALQITQEISDRGRAANNDAAIYVLALIAAQKVSIKRTSKAGREYTVTEPTDVARKAWLALPVICRTFTHFSHFMTFIKKGKMRGFGRAFQRALADAWFNNKTVDQIVWSLIKYQSRDGFSQSEVYRLLRPAKFKSVAGLEDRKALYDHIFYTGDKAVGPQHPRLAAAKTLLQSTDATEALRIMKEHKLPMESVPTNLRTPEIYAEALNQNGMDWIVRNLGNLSKVGLTKPFNPVLSVITDKLSDAEHIRKARLHPLTIAKAMHQYKQGKGLKSDSSWEVNPQILAALTDAFYKSFEYLEPSGKRILIAVDVSGSMSCAQATGIPGMTVHEAAGILSMAVARTEKLYHVIAFDHAGYSWGRGNKTGDTGKGYYEVPVTPTQRLDDIQRTFSQYGGGGTDCALPFQYLMDKGLDVDLVISLTDSETWAGRVHVMDALNKYRARVKHPVRAVNVCMASNYFTNFDPKDPDCLEVIGFDVQIPSLITEFAKM